MKHLSNKPLLLASALGLIALGVSANASQEVTAAKGPSLGPTTTFAGSGGVIVSRRRIPPLSETRPKEKPTQIPPNF